MALKPIDKRQLVHIVARCQNGDVTHSEINTLFIIIREYSYNYTSIREIANSVAHRSERDQGTFTDVLQTSSLALTHALKFNGKTFNLNMPISKETITLIENLIKYIIPDSELTSKSNSYTRKGLLDKFKKSCNKLSQDYFEFKPKNVSDLDMIKNVCGYIGYGIAFNQHQIISELIALLTELEIQVNTKTFEKNSHKIILYILAFLHNTKFVFKNSKDSEMTGYAYAGLYWRNDTVSRKGNIVLYGSVTAKQDTLIRCGIIVTDINFFEVCHDFKSLPEMQDFFKDSQFTPDDFLIKEWILTDDYKIALQALSHTQEAKLK